jgi:hypothetical protein
VSTQYPTDPPQPGSGWPIEQVEQPPKPPRRKVVRFTRMWKIATVLVIGLIVVGLIVGWTRAEPQELQLPDSPVIAKNERQMATASKVRAAQRLTEAKAEWAAEARRVAREKARQAAIERERERREAAAAEAARPSQAPDNPSGPPTCPEVQNYVPYAGKCVWGDW